MTMYRMGAGVQSLNWLRCEVRWRRFIAESVEGTEICSYPGPSVGQAVG